VVPWVNLEDGNADKEAEKLVPSPNFYVLMVCSKNRGRVEKVFIGPAVHMLCNHSHSYPSERMNFPD